MWYWIPVLWLLFFVISQQRKKQKTAAVVRHIKNRKKETEAMEALAKQFTGKECIIYTINSNDGSIAGINPEAPGSSVMISLNRKNFISAGGYLNHYLDPGWDFRT